MRAKLLVLLAVLVALPVAAQWEPPDAPKEKPNDGGPALVYFAHSYFRDHPNVAGLDDRISLHVQNLDSLLSKVDNNCSALVLFLDGMPLKGIQPESCDRISGHVRYRLERVEKDDAAWHELLGSPTNFTRPVSVSIGSTTSFSALSNVTNFELEVIPASPFHVYLILLLVTLIGFVYLCTHTPVIRGGQPSQGLKDRPFSLSLFQMAFWFFLVIAAYVFIWLICDELNTITDSVLGLIGIGAATAVGAKMVNDRTTGSDAPSVTHGFVSDLISDANGVSIHRLQMFVWTLVLGVIFLASVYKDLAMPEFSATLLGLMGISSGTYLGVKTQASKNDASSPPPPPNGSTTEAATETAS
ncbi:MAG TPA: hypothetical protein VGJ88_04025 [Thermoanaerobaculia bacterium]